MSINQRVDIIIKELYGGNKRAFATASNIAPTVVENIVGKRRGNPSYEVLEKIICANENIEAEWLVTGRGQMLKSEVNSNIKIFVPEDLPKVVGNLYRAPIYESYPVSAGKMGLAEMRDEKPNGYAYTTLPGVTFFPVVGCSFEPIIYAGEYIGVIRLNSWDRFDTEKIYFIVTHEERMLKRLRVDENRGDILWCVSPNFREFTILKEDILHINHVFFHGKMV